MFFFSKEMDSAGLNDCVKDINFNKHFTQRKWIGWAKMTSQSVFSLNMCRKEMDRQAKMIVYRVYQRDQHVLPAANQAHLHQTSLSTLLIFIDVKDMLAYGNSSQQLNSHTVQTPFTLSHRLTKTHKTRQCATFLCLYSA